MFVANAILRLHILLLTNKLTNINLVSKPCFKYDFCPQFAAKMCSF
jgi:hypothetical protein